MRSGSAFPIVVFVMYPSTPAFIMCATSSRELETVRAMNLTAGFASLTASMTTAPPPPGSLTSRTTTSGELDVENHHLGCSVNDQLDGTLNVVRLANDVEGVAQEGAHASTDNVMIIDEENPETVSQVQVPIVILMSVPSPPSESTWTMPPIPSTRFVSLR